MGPTTYSVSSCNLSSLPNGEDSIVKIREAFVSTHPDILCLQGISQEAFTELFVKNQNVKSGYDHIFKSHPGQSDGIAILFKKTLLEAHDDPVPRFSGDVREATEYWIDQQYQVYMYLRDKNTNKIIRVAVCNFSGDKEIDSRNRQMVVLFAKMQTQNPDVQIITGNFSQIDRKVQTQAFESKKYRRVNLLNSSSSGNSTEETIFAKSNDANIKVAYERVTLAAGVALPVPGSQQQLPPTSADAQGEINPKTEAQQDTTAINPFPPGTESHAILEVFKKEFYSKRQKMNTQLQGTIRSIVIQALKDADEQTSGSRKVFHERLEKQIKEYSQNWVGTGGFTQEYREGMIKYLPRAIKEAASLLEPVQPAPVTPQSIRGTSIATPVAVVSQSVVSTQAGGPSAPQASQPVPAPSVAPPKTFTAAGASLVGKLWSESTLFKIFSILTIGILPLLTWIYGGVTNRS